MVAAVQMDDRAWHRQRTRSAASGPVFTLPSLPGLAEAAPLLPTAPACVPSPSGSAAAAPSLDLSAFLGRSIGSGQCVALARAVQPALGPAATWTAGAAVQGNNSLQPGAVIATFNGADRYANATDGSSHAAVYLGQDAHGIQVLDQWSGREAAVRTIPWNHPGGTAANTGGAYRVVRSS